LSGLAQNVTCTSTSRDGEIAVASLDLIAERFLVLLVDVEQIRREGCFHTGSLAGGDNTAGVCVVGTFDRVGSWVPFSAIRVTSSSSWTVVFGSKGRNGGNNGSVFHFKIKESLLYLSI